MQKSSDNLVPEEFSSPSLGPNGPWLVFAIATFVFKATPKNPRRLRRQSAAIGRRLRLLRAHRIIREIPRIHRYTLTPHGRNLVTAPLAAQHADSQKLTALAA